MPKATKRWRLVTYCDGLTPIMLNDFLITWSCKIMWQTETAVSPLP